MRNDQERESLAAKFERHADEEGKILTQYRALAEQLGSGSAGMLVDQILTEEEVHHLLLRTMAKWLRERTAESPIPRDADRSALLSLTHTLHQHERDTIDACRSLQSQLGANGNTLIGALLEAMALDSEKHNRLLGAVEKMLGA